MTIATCLPSSVSLGSYPSPPSSAAAAAAAAARPRAQHPSASMFATPTPPPPALQATPQSQSSSAPLPSSASAATPSTATATHVPAAATPPPLRVSPTLTSPPIISPTYGAQPPTYVPSRLAQTLCVITPDPIEPSAADFSASFFAKLNLAPTPVAVPRGSSAGAPFAFDTPSPDDVVLQQQAKAFSKVPDKGTAPMPRIVSMSLLLLLLTFIACYREQGTVEHPPSHKACDCCCCYCNDPNADAECLHERERYDASTCDSRRRCGAHDLEQQRCQGQGSRRHSGARVIRLGRTQGRQANHRRSKTPARRETRYSRHGWKAALEHGGDRSRRCWKEHHHGPSIVSTGPRNATTNAQVRGYCCLLMLLMPLLLLS